MTCEYFWDEKENLKNLAEPRTASNRLHARLVLALEELGIVLLIFFRKLMS